MVKINKLEIENVKRVKAVMIEPTANGLTIVGGRNGQGKTSVLDSIAWVLGGNKYAPSNPKREGSVVDPILKIELDNGLVVERKGVKGTLKVIDPSGNKSGQKLLDTFVETFAINLPTFLNSSPKEKTIQLLNTVDGLGEKLYELDNEESELYNKRRTIGQIAEQKKHFAEEQPFFKDVGSEIISANELISQQQEILVRNGENQRKRNNVAQLEQSYKNITNEIERLTTLLNEARAKEENIISDLDIAKTDILVLIDESTEELERNIENIEEINRKVRANQDRERAEDEAKKYKEEYDILSEKINEVRKNRISLLDNANLPLKELSVENGTITYKGQPWDNMSGSEQLIVATAIVRKINPKCEFVLVDKLEQMDLETLKEFGDWLEKEKLQAIATRVSTGEECQIIIEDGYVKENRIEKKEDVPKWQMNNGGGF